MTDNRHFALFYLQVQLQVVEVQHEGVLQLHAEEPREQLLLLLLRQDGYVAVVQIYLLHQRL